MVSFITVNYNGLEVTSALLCSLREQITSCEWEVIVVDNASKTDEAAELRRRFPWAKVLRSEVNLGFAGGNNLALPEAVGDYLFFINNDTEFFSDNLSRLCDTLEAHPDAGMVCPKICFFSDPQRIQYAGYTPMRGIRMRNGMIGYGQLDDGSYDTPGPTAFPHGAAMMVRHSALEAVGPMPECYFLYYEELDWGASSQRAGWTILYEPSFTIYHKDSLTTGRESPLSAFYKLRGRQIFAYRNFRGALRWGALLFTRCVAVPKHALTAWLKGQKEVARACLRANRDFRRMRKEGCL